MACSWHWDKAVTKNIKDEELLAEVKSLRLIPDPTEFWGLFNAFLQRHPNNPDVKKFVKNFGENGLVCPPPQWVRAFNPGFNPHNLFPERQVISNLF